MITIDLTDEHQQRIAELLDRYAHFLERGDESGAAALLDNHPELNGEWGGHLESLQALCRATREIGRDNKREKPDAFADGSVLGDYRLNREIGRGGMGIVYEATQLSLRRSVALKVLPFAAVLDKQQVARFRNEAQAAALLHHPHIVPVFAVGCERGVHYYSMQLIDGQTLEQLLHELTPQASDFDVSQHESSPPPRDSDPSSRIHQQTTMGAPENAGAMMQGLPVDGLERGLERPRQPLGDKSTEVALTHRATTAQTIRNRNYIQNTVELMICVAEALDFAHQQGVVHRDVKPSNLLIDSAGKVWVADFGLARVRGLGEMTAEGKVMGTARYMSPEQIAARPQEIDHRTDIYSLGITLYELLTMQPAFDAPNREALFRAIEELEPVSPRRLNPSVPLDLETIVLKSVAKRKDDRYATAGEMAEDLRRFLDGKPTLARRPTPAERVIRWAMRRQRLVATLFGLMLIALAGLTLATLLVTRQSHLKDQAVARAQLHLDQAHALVDRFGGLMSNRLAHLQGADGLRTEVLEEAEAYYLGFLEYAGNDESLRGELAKVQYRLGATYVKLGRFEPAERKYRESLATYDLLDASLTRSDEIQADRALCLHNLAALQKQQGRYSDARQNYEAASRIQQPLMERNPSDSRFLGDWAMTQNNLGLLLWQCHEQTESVRLLGEVQSRLCDTLQRAPEDRLLRLQLIECRNSLVASLLEQNLDDAESLLTANLEDLHSLGDPTNGPSPTIRPDRWPDGQSVACQLAVTRNNLATVLARKGDVRGAIDLAYQAIEELRMAVRRDLTDLAAEEQLAILHNNLGMLLWRSVREKGATMQDEAVSAFEVAEKSLRNQSARSNQQPESLNRLAGVLHNLGQVHESLGKTVAAIDYLTEALELQAQAVRQAPFDQIYRDHLERHRELLDHILSQLKDSAVPPRQETVRQETVRQETVRQETVRQQTVGRETADQGTDISRGNRAARQPVIRSMNDA